jgi:hypothetical protein
MNNPHDYKYCTYFAYHEEFPLGNIGAAGPLSNVLYNAEQSCSHQFAVGEGSNAEQTCSHQIAVGEVITNLSNAEQTCSLQVKLVGQHPIILVDAAVVSIDTGFY